MVIRPRLVAIIFHKNEFTGEIVKEIKVFASKFTSFYHAKIPKIRAIQFCFINLYKLYYLMGCNNIYQDQILISKNMLKMHEIIGNQKKI